MRLVKSFAENVVALNLQFLVLIYVKEKGDNKNL